MGDKSEIHIGSCDQRLHALTQEKREAKIRNAMLEPWQGRAGHFGFLLSLGK
jgi:hypothetical protein